MQIFEYFVQSKKRQSQSFVGLSNMFELNASTLLSDAHLDYELKAYIWIKKNSQLSKNLNQF